MKPIVSLALLVVGIVLVINGFHASNSLSSDLSRFFTSSPTTKAIWMLIGGIVAGVIGVLGLMRSAKDA
jgi:hypothetical protein